MYNLTLSFCLLCLVFCSCSPKTILPAVETQPKVTLSEKSDTLPFPDGWTGIWTGELEIYKAGGLAQKLPMELHILPLDTVDRYSWTLIYGPDKVAGARPYQLVVKDREKGLYVVDEMNSIELECYYLHNKLFNWYLVEKSLILVTNEMRGEEMIFEVIAGTDEPVSITGGKEVDGEEIPAVSTYPVNVAQRAVLTRKK